MATAMETPAKGLRHAYCIIAHNDAYCLQTLIDLIDDTRNDIFILFDKNCDKRQFKEIHATKSQIYFPKQEVGIFWGDLSQIRAELTLFETVLKSGKEYAYLHLISGCDLPLHNQDFIHDYFKSLPLGTNLIGFSGIDGFDRDLKRKTSYRHILKKQFRDKNRLRKIICSAIRKSWIFIQKIFNYKVDWRGYKLAKGANWVSITPEFAAFLVANTDEILSRFKYVRCGDEIYKQTLTLSSRFKDTLLNTEDEYKGCMRKIDWLRGNPYTWRSKDFEELMNSEAIFARKFQSSVDKEIIDRIHAAILKN